MDPDLVAAFSTIRSAAADYLYQLEHSSAAPGLDRTIVPLRSALALSDAIIDELAEAQR